MTLHELERLQELLNNNHLLMDPIPSNECPELTQLCVKLLLAQGVSYQQVRAAWYAIYQQDRATKREEAA